MFLSKSGLHTGQLLAVKRGCFLSLPAERIDAFRPVHVLYMHKQGCVIRACVQADTRPGWVGWSSEMGVLNAGMSEERRGEEREEGRTGKTRLA